MFPKLFTISQKETFKSLKSFPKYFIKGKNLSKTQVTKIIKSVGFPGKPFRPLMSVGLLLIKDILKPLTKIVLVLLGLMSTPSSVDVRVHQIS